MITYADEMNGEVPLTDNAVGQLGRCSCAHGGWVMLLLWQM